MELSDTFTLKKQFTPQMKSISLGTMLRHCWLMRPTRTLKPADGRDGIRKVRENRIGRHRPTPAAGRRRTDDGIRPNCDDGGRGGGARWSRVRSGRDGEA